MSDATKLAELIDGWKVEGRISADDHRTAKTLCATAQPPNFHLGIPTEEELTACMKENWHFVGNDLLPDFYQSSAILIKRLLRERYATAQPTDAGMREALAVKIREHYESRSKVGFVPRFNLEGDELLLAADALAALPVAGTTRAGIVDECVRAMAGVMGMAPETAGGPIFDAVRALAATSSPAPSEDAALAAQITRLLDGYLNATNSAIKECEARALRELLWDNKVRIASALSSTAAPTDGANSSGEK